MPSLLRRLAGLLALMAAASPLAWAQPTDGAAFPPDRIAQGTAYFVYTEPGAPMVEVLLIRSPGGSGLYRVAEETTLTEFLALSGGTALPREETDRVIRTSTIRLLRPDGSGSMRVAYEAAPEQLLREPGRHPALLTGDIVEIVTETTEKPDRVTFLEGLDIAARVAGVVSLIVILATQIGRTN